MPKKLDEEIIELTEVVEDDQEPGDVDEFLSAFDEHELFKQPAPSVQAKQDELADEDLESFFGEAGSSKVERLSGPGAGQVSEKMPDAVLQEPAFDEEFQSMLNGLTNEIQENQQEGVTKEEPGEALDLEKQWKAALGGEEEGGEAERIKEREDTLQTHPGELTDLAEPQGKPLAAAPAIPLEESPSAQINRQVGDLLTSELVEEALEKAFRQVLEPLAERILTEAAEKILIQEIERVKADLRSVERKA